MCSCLFDLGDSSLPVEANDGIQGVILKTTPQPWFMTPQPVLPPSSVVPYRFPDPSRTKAATGNPPSAAPVKLYSTVSSPCLSKRKTIPQPGPALMAQLESPPALVVP